MASACSTAPTDDLFEQVETTDASTGAGTSEDAPESLDSSATGADEGAAQTTAASQADGSGGEETSGTSGSDATTDAVDDGGPQPVDDRIFPLALGRRWTYQVTSSGPYCPPGERTMEVVDTLADVPMGEGFQMTWYCGDGLVNVAVDGDVVETELPSSPGQWSRQTDEPVEDGHSWVTSNGSASYSLTYHEEGSVQTAAGTFDECWRIVQEVSYTSEWIYCRGVGLVRSNLIDLGGGGYSIELVDKNF